MSNLHGSYEAELGFERNPWIYSQTLPTAPWNPGIITKTYEPETAFAKGCMRAPRQPRLAVRPKTLWIIAYPKTAQTARMHPEGT